ncbi:hypothetical protein LTR96_011200 [Exophiala xenobiotica]|nr:hypothetical protein LTR41_011466 [Exophiala xenobiotica]KAK5215596.1 hypothetical protein LTR72_011367 [Exophiala xenobiotica]KAK5220970.1 hypothetical protein LTR47_010987 [Exophiala xenobiotica]KAK5243961.1 hypothetical protein LTS06_010384 [Exophiala xenobiotica]KAK5260710.1 hypothetical protein LTR40_003630 [Exophiala xenobiotica]
MVRTVNVVATILAGENLALDILAGPWELQSVPFTVASAVDQAIQIFMWIIFYRRVFQNGGDLLRSTDLSQAHAVWGLSRSALQIIFSIVVVAISVTWPRHQLLYSLIQVNLVLIYPTPRAFVRYTRLRGRPRENFLEHARPNLNTGRGASGENLVAFSDISRQASRSSTSTVRAGIVKIDGHCFHFSPTEARHFYMVDAPDDRCSLRTLRQRLPWSATYPPDQYSSEEFLLLSPDFPPDHPYCQGQPALLDIFRDIHKKDLQNTIANFPAHRDACDQCLKGKCRSLFRLMCMLLLDLVHSQATLRLNDQDMISSDGMHTDQFYLTSVAPQESSVSRLGFVLASNARTIDIAWEDLWQINSLGIYMSLSSEMADILPGWFENVTRA